jgi:16S rRNA (uracil1498-N3)-methyltransferase
MTRRRWIADDWDNQSASLKGEQAAHLIRVLRAQTGMECDMVAGDRVWRAVISGISGDAVQFALLSEVEAEPALPVTLLLSVFKFDRMEWIIEKATELGAERFIPMTARRTEKHLAQAATARVERWRRVAREAAKQSRRSDVPVVEDVISMKAAVKIRPAAPGLSLLLAEQERSRTLYAAMQSGLQQSMMENPSVYLAVGPEGGWTAEE